MQQILGAESGGGWEGEEREIILFPLPSTYDRIAEVSCITGN